MTVEPYATPTQARSAPPESPTSGVLGRVRRWFAGPAPLDVPAPQAPPELRYSLNDWVMWQMGYAGNTYPLMGGGGSGIRQTLTGEYVEPAVNGFEGYARLMGANPVVLSCMLLRANVFSQARFQWQQLLDGRPSKLFGTPALQPLELPWPNGTTQDLLTRVAQDGDLSGNFYSVLETSLARLGGDGSKHIVRLRPDWAEWIMEPRVLPGVAGGGQVGWRKVGLRYTEGGCDSGNDSAFFLPEDVAHFAPIPDPCHPWRGMSWLTPLIREIHADGLMSAHRAKYFENGATPNLVITYPIEARREQVQEFRKLLEAENIGLDKAYAPLHLGLGADVTVVGNDLAQIDFKSVQGGGETRIAAAAGTPAVLVGLSEGMQGSSLNAGNYAMARRRMADATAHPWWQNVSGSLAPMVGPAPRADRGATRLWYDVRDVPFVREDESDAATIQQTRAGTLRTYVDAGFTPESALAAMLADDEGLLVHSGLYSVQLQAPGAQSPPATTPPPAAGGANA